MYRDKVHSCAFTEIRFQAFASSISSLHWHERDCFNTQRIWAKLKNKWTKIASFVLCHLNANKRVHLHRYGYSNISVGDIASCLALSLKSNQSVFVLTTIKGKMVENSVPIIYVDIVANSTLRSSNSRNVTKSHCTHKKKDIKMEVRNTATTSLLRNIKYSRLEIVIMAEILMLKQNWGNTLPFNISFPYILCHPIFKRYYIGWRF